MTAVASSMRGMKDLKDRAITKGGHLYSIPLDQLNEKDGWNVRDYDDESTAVHIRNIADAIKDGQSVDPIAIFVEDGIIYIADGHCRHHGALLARSEGAEIEKLQAVEVRGNRDDLLALISTSNKGLALNPIEKAIIYQRYQNWGRDIAEISKRVRESESHIKAHLELLMLPVEIQKMIRSGKLAYTTALAEYANFGNEEEAVKVFEKAASDAEAAGKKKITPKAIRGDAAPKRKSKKYTKQLVGDMSSALISILDDSQASFDAEDNATLTFKMTRDQMMNLERMISHLKDIDAAQQADGKETDKDYADQESDDQ